MLPMDEDEQLAALIDDLTFFIDCDREFDGKKVDSIIDQYWKNGELSERQIKYLSQIHVENHVAELLRRKGLHRIVDEESERML